MRGQYAEKKLDWAKDSSLRKVLRMENSFYENILGHLEESVFVLDKNGSIVYANEYLLKNGIMTKDEVLSLNTYKLLSSGQSDIHIFDMVKKSKQSVTALQTLSTVTGNTRETYMVTQVPVLDRQGEVELSIGIIRHIPTIEGLYDGVLRAEKHVLQNSFVNAPQNPSISTMPIYRSEIMEKLLRTAGAVAASDVTVLVRGESGVGKEVLANYLHQASGRCHHKMLALNCAALTENLLESELFGYEKGAFTGAAPGGRKGLLEEADGGTVFLDEVDSLPLTVQAKLLRVLETHEVRPIGGKEQIKTDFRVIAATNANLEEKVAVHEFREDLFYRLNILPLTIPPLRERPEDILLLAEHFLNIYGKKYGRHKTLSDKAGNMLMAYDWPGNVRELRNFIERLVLTTDISVQEICDIPEAFLKQSAKQSTLMGEKDEQKMEAQRNLFYQEGPILKEGVSLKKQVRDLERQLIDKAVVKYGSLSRAATALQIDKSSLIRKRKAD